jgi:cellobiose-specific phosphotransferase system component IIC
VSGNKLFGGHLRGSISSYYYTRVGNVFVGVLFALAVFFLSYNYKPLRNFETDGILSKLLSLFAVGVAVFPTAEKIGAADRGEQLVSAVHLSCAGLLFVLLGVFSFFRFTLSDKPPDQRDKDKRARNAVFRICGLTIFGAIALVLLSMWAKPPASWHSLLWLETICVEAFGVSWLVKSGHVTVNGGAGNAT